MEARPPVLEYQRPTKREGPPFDAPGPAGATLAVTTVVLLTINVFAMATESIGAVQFLLFLDVIIAFTVPFFVFARYPDGIHWTVHVAFILLTLGLAAACVNWIGRAFASC